MKKDQHIPGAAPKNLLLELQVADPERHVVFTAIDRLKEPALMVQFFQQYVDSLALSTQDDPAKLARDNFSCALSYISSEAEDRWMEVIG